MTECNHLWVEMYRATSPRPPTPAHLHCLRCNKSIPWQADIAAATKEQVEKFWEQKRGRKLG